MQDGPDEEDEGIEEEGREDGYSHCVGCYFEEHRDLLSGGFFRLL